MSIDTINFLNDTYAISDHVAFKAGPGDLPVAEINNAFASATVSVHGGHVISFQPHGQAPVLWASKHSAYAEGKAIRGGIPVCWPWFGPHPTDSSKPAHGFVRTQMWAVIGTSVAANDATQVRLRITDDETTQALCPYPFELDIIITVGTELEVELVARNTGNETFTCGGALHSYFTVSDVRAIAIHGLDGCSYIDQLDPAQLKVQHGPITFNAETDNVYLDTTATCRIEDPGLSRHIEIAKSGSHSTVVWNPWIAKAQRMPDFGDQEYLGMVCVETANAKDDVVTLPPAGEHALRAVIQMREA